MTLSNYQIVSNSNSSTFKKYFAFAIFALFLVSCTKNNNDTSGNQTINCAPLLIDPANMVASEIDVAKNAKQFVYQAIEVQKGMSGMLATFTADSVKKYQFHVYIFTAGRYYPLPSTTTGSNKYSYTIVSNSAYSTVNVVRTAGVTENFDAIKVVAVSYNYMLEQQYAIDYTNFATVQKAFALP